MAQHQHLGVPMFILRGWRNPTKKGEGYICFDTETPHPRPLDHKDVFSAPDAADTEAEAASAKIDSDAARVRNKILGAVQANRFYPFTKNDVSNLAQFMDLCGIRALGTQDYLDGEEVYAALQMQEDVAPSTVPALAMPAKEFREWVRTHGDAFKASWLRWKSSAVKMISRRPEESPILSVNGLPFWKNVSGFMQILVKQKTHITIGRIPPTSKLRFLLGNQCWEKSLQLRRVSSYQNPQYPGLLTRKDVDVLLFLAPDTIVQFSALKTPGVGEVVPLRDGLIDYFNRLVIQSNDMVVFAGSPEAKERYWVIWQEEKKLQGKR